MMLGLAGHARARKERSVTKPQLSVQSLHVDNPLQTSALSIVLTNSIMCYAYDSRVGRIRCRQRLCTKAVP